MLLRFSYRVIVLGEALICGSGKHGKQIPLTVLEHDKYEQKFNQHCAPL